MTLVPPHIVAILLLLGLVGTPAFVLLRRLQRDRFIRDYRFFAQSAAPPAPAPPNPPGWFRSPAIQSPHISDSSRIVMRWDELRASHPKDLGAGPPRRP